MNRLPNERATARDNRVALLVLGIFGLVAISLLLVVGIEYSATYHPRGYGTRPTSGLLIGEIELRFRTRWPQVAYYFPRDAGAKLPEKIWVAFCGNGSLALDWVELVRQTPPAAGSFLLVDYPGYGQSAGGASISGNEAAADGALTALAHALRLRETDLEPRLNVLGHSLGAAAALEFAAHHPVQRVVLVAPFTSLREEFAHFIGGPFSHLVLDNYDNRARLAELSQRRPTPRIAIFHGARDEMIPIAMGQDLARSFPAMIEFFPVARADHTTVLEIGLPRISSGWRVKPPFRLRERSAAAMPLAEAPLTFE